MQWTVGKIGAAAGVAFLVLNVIANALPGSPPGTDDSGAKIASFFAHHHRAVVIGAILTGLAAPLFLALVTALALRLRVAGEGTAAAAVFAFGTVALALGIVSDALYVSLARIGADGNTSLAKGVYELDGFIAAKSFWFAAAAALVAGWAARRVLVQWYAAISLAAAVVLAVGGASLRFNGFFAPLGAMSGIAFLALLVWTLATCAFVWREPVPVVP